MERQYLSAHYLSQATDPQLILVRLNGWHCSAQAAPSPLEGCKCQWPSEATNLNAEFNLNGIYWHWEIRKQTSFIFNIIIFFFFFFFCLLNLPFYQPPDWWRSVPGCLHLSSLALFCSITGASGDSVSPPLSSFSSLHPRIMSHMVERL